MRQTLQTKKALLRCAQGVSVVWFTACGPFNFFDTKKPTAPELNAGPSSVGIEAPSGGTGNPPQNELGDGKGVQSLPTLSPPSSGAIPVTVAPVKPLCEFYLDCPIGSGGNPRFQLVYKCESFSRQSELRVMGFPECSTVKTAIDGLRLPTGKTTLTLQGGPRVSAVCGGGNVFVLQIPYNNTQEAHPLDGLPAKVCEELRDIINGLKV